MATKKTSVNPRTVNVGGKYYSIVSVTKAQTRGRSTDTIATGDESIDTFRGERVAVLKPL